MDVCEQSYQDKNLWDEEFSMPFKTAQNYLGAQLGDSIESKII
jgi:hypothetical protein